MCDYCGCRSEPEIAALSADHERMLALTAALRRAHETDTAAPELIAELTGMLGPHARREERGVFAALVAEGIDAAYVLQFEHEHDTLEELLGRADVPHQIEQIVDLLEDHILREESDLFPAAHQLLGSDAWAMIAASTATDAPTSEQ
jgi:hemerythrin-like domain-containing protein